MLISIYHVQGIHYPGQDIVLLAIGLFKRRKKIAKKLEQNKFF